MSIVIYPSEKDLFGPWLLESSHLQKLDELIDNQMTKLEIYRAKIINDRFEMLKYKENSTKISDDELMNQVKNKYDIQSFNKKIIVKFNSGKTILAKSFKEITMNKDFENDIPKTFTYNLECVDIKAEISNDLWTDNTIRLKVNTLSIQEANELFYELDNWLKQVSPPLYVKLWKRFGTWLLVILSIILFLISSSKTTTKDQLKIEAHNLLEKGINSEEIAKGIEILLSIETDYEKDTLISSKYEWNVKSILKIFLIISILLAGLFPPNSTIGICKGEIKLKQWKIWIKFITYFVPIMIILPIIINLITNRL